MSDTKELRDAFVSLFSSESKGGDKDLTREQRIQLHIKKLWCAENVGQQKLVILTPANSTPDRPFAPAPDLSTLTSISISELALGRTAHRGRVLYCTVVTPPLLLASAMTLVDDANGNLANIAVYNLNDAELQLFPGRKLAIIEPLYKVRTDGTPGIRIDDPSNEIKFDVESGRESPADIQTMHKSKLEQSGNEPSTAPRIPDRRPEMHRFITGVKTVMNRDLGNKSFQGENFDEAEKYYTLALQSAADGKSDVGQSEDQEGVALWTLYSNRAVTLLKLGNLDNALKDAIKSHQCAPIGPMKPLLRCAQALSALGYYAEAKATLETAKALPLKDGLELNQSSMEKIMPRKVLYVGPSHEFKTIVSAIRAAPPDSEILVEAGIYSEPIELEKPVTLRSLAVSLADRSSSDRAEIQVTFPLGGNAISFVGTSNSSRVSMRIIGFRVTYCGPAELAGHAAMIINCTAVFRDCSFRSLCGPGICAEGRGRLIIENCVVRDGAQGGILVSENSALTIRCSRVCHNAASGVELRDGGSGVVEDCEIFSNDRQGILVWKKAGMLRVERSKIHSHRNESGVIVVENEDAAIFRDCTINTNQMSGVNVKYKGKAEVIDCMVFNNMDGIQIQGKGNAIVSNCSIYQNVNNGVCVGLDHRGNATIEGNRLCGNGMKGLCFAAGLSTRLQVSNNTEQYNLGRHPSIIQGPSDHRDTKWAKRVMKNAKSCDTVEELVFRTTVATAGQILGCAFCNRQPNKREKFSRCSQCLDVFYCSHQCQLKDWKRGHKNTCVLRKPKYKSFLDPNTAID